MTDGNGDRRCVNLLATLALFEIAVVLLLLNYVGSVPVLPLSRYPFVPSLRSNQPNHPSSSQRPIHLSCLEILLRFLCVVQRGASHDLPIKRIRLIPL